MDALFSVAGKIVLVTGGTSGIGAMIARGFVERGAITYIVGRDLSAGQAVVKAMNQLGTCNYIPGNLSRSEGVSALVAAFSEREETLDVLVNNAGVMYEAPIDEYVEEGWDGVIDLNLKSVFFLTQKLLPKLRAAASARGSASVINIGSAGGLRVGPKENYAYQAAKAGLHHLTGALARRLGPENITVNAIAPGFFPSKLTQPTAEQMPMILAAVPRRRLGEPEDMVGASVYLASRAGGFVTGAVIPVTGGMTL